MKVRKVNQYQCDFCGKKNYSAPHMRTHEKHCTMNPNRECRMCASMDEGQLEIDTLLNLLPRPIFGNEYIKSWFGMECNDYTRLILVNLEDINKSIKKMKDFVYCPACIMSAIRQKGIPPRWTEFDFKSECSDFW